MREARYWLLLGLLVLAAGCSNAGNDPTAPPLATGRWINTSVAQSSQDVGELPLNMIVSPDGRFAITTGSGYGLQQLNCVRVSDDTLVSHLDFPSDHYSKDKVAKSNGLYYGLAFGPDGKLYAAQGNAKAVAVVSVDSDGKLSLDRQLKLDKTDFPAGLAADQKGRLYVCHNDPTNKQTFGTPASVSVLDTSTGSELGRYVFANDMGLSNFPMAMTVNPDGSRLYVSSERDAVVYVLDASDPAHITEVARVATGSHPIALLLNKSRSRLYVANAQSDTISIIDTAANRVISTVLVRPEIVKDLAGGATPTALALSADEKTLYAALGDMNAVAVIDLADASGAELEGYIPAGWYPIAVAVVGNELLITNFKGDHARVIHDPDANGRMGDPLPLFHGTLWRVAIPSEDQLDALTQQCLTDARLTPQHLTEENPLASVSLSSGNIRHVIYIVKENRSYDQVLGDLPQGNGDPDRCLFGRAITPNEHALAERFVLLDNFYCSGEVSGDGWTWSTEAQANEYTVRNVPYQYSRRGRVQDYEGSNNYYPTGGFPATGPSGEPLSDDPRFAKGARPITDVAESPGGHIWDMVRRNGLTYRNYGFFMSFGVKDGEKFVIPDNYPASAGVQPGGIDLGGITDVDYRKFDLNFPDSDMPYQLATHTGDDAYLWKKTTFGRFNLPSRIAEWKREFGLMLAKDPTGNGVPAFMTIRLGTDHTQAARSLNPSPSCMVADNDYAVGELVERISHSPIWTNTAIIIVEDDAQNGPDHVDAHRSTCFVISPWIKRGTIDHSYQNTVSVMRTLEDLLDLPPMCQYDAASGVVGGWDNSPANIEPYDALAADAAIFKERNAKSDRPEDTSPEQQSSLPPRDLPLNSAEELADVSAQMDFNQADQVPADLLNRVIWKTVRGTDSEMPTTPHTPGDPAGNATDKDDGD